MKIKQEEKEQTANDKRSDKRSLRYVETVALLFFCCFFDCSFAYIKKKKTITHTHLLSSLSLSLSLSPNPLEPTQVAVAAERETRRRRRRINPIRTAIARTMLPLMTTRWHGEDRLLRRREWNESSAQRSEQRWNEHVQYDSRSKTRLWKEQQEWQNHRGMWRVCVCVYSSNNHHWDKKKKRRVDSVVSFSFISLNVIVGCYLKNVFVGKYQ